MKEEQIKNFVEMMNRKRGTYHRCSCSIVKFRIGRQNLKVQPQVKPLIIGFGEVVDYKRMILIRRAMESYVSQIQKYGFREIEYGFTNCGFGKNGRNWLRTLRT